MASLIPDLLREVGIYRSTASPGQPTIAMLAVIASAGLPCSAQASAKTFTIAAKGKAGGVGDWNDHNAGPYTARAGARSEGCAGR